jgi:flagellar hook protein FlgE
MRKGNLTREQAIEAAGLEAVEKVESMNCDFSNRVQTDGDTAVEFESCVYFIDNEGNKRSLTAYYYQEQEDLDEVEDMGSLDWEINGYELW